MWYECVATMVQEFRTTERASGVHLTHQGVTLASAGDRSDYVVQPGAVASIVRTPDQRIEFSIVASRSKTLADRSYLGN